MPFRPANPGDPLEISAREWNLVRERAFSARGRGQPPPAPDTTPDLVRFLNQTGSDLPRGGVVALQGPYHDPSADPVQLAAWDRDRLLVGVVPQDKLHFWRFGIVTLPTRAGQVGHCVVSGLVVARVWIVRREHWFASPYDGMTSALVSCQAGSAQIVAKESPLATGAQWCLLRLSNTPGRLYRLRSCDDPQQVLYTQSNLADFVDRIVRLRGQQGCYLVEFPSCWDEQCKTAVCVEVVGVHDQCADCRDCWKLTDCSNTSNIKYTGTDLSFYDGKVVKLQGDPGTCWQVAREKQNCSNLVDVTVEEEFDQCSDCTCWKLTNCHDETHELWTTSNLARQLGTTADQAKGKIVELLEYAGCWKVADYGSQYCSAQAVPVTVKNEREDCSCPCLVLTDCSNSSNTMLVTRAVNSAGKVIDLEQYVGQVVRDSNGTCWQVARLTDPAQCGQHPPGSITVLEAYDDCATCSAGLVELTQCGTTTKIKTYSDLSPWGPVALGNVYIDESGQCWEVTATGLAWDPNAVDFYAIGTAADCTACSQNYKLVVDCRLPECTSSSTPRDLVVSDPRLAGHVGQYVKLGGWCYKISTTTAAANDSLQDWDGRFYEDCQSCLDAPLTMKLPWPIGVCEDTDGKLKFRWGHLIYRDGVPVGVCDEGCEKPPACTNECDTGSGSGGGGGGGGGTNNCACQNMPDQLTLTITSGTGACACWQGKSTTLTWDAGLGMWTGSMSDPTCGILAFRLECSSSGVHPTLYYNCDGGGLYLDTFNPVTLDCTNRKITYSKTLPSGCCDMGVGGDVSAEVTW